MELTPAERARLAHCCQRRICAVPHQLTHLAHQAAPNRSRSTGAGSWVQDSEGLQKVLGASDIYSVGEIAVAALPTLSFHPGGFPHEEREKWLEVRELLIDAEPSVLPSEVPTNPVPIARPRRFYETLRLFPTSAVHRHPFELRAADHEISPCERPGGGDLRMLRR